MVLVALTFVVALVVRLGIVSAEHLEYDEQLYTALVQQLDAGRGYTLQGHSILAHSWVAQDQYDQPLFYHPPGAIALFWAVSQIFPRDGMAVAQLVSFSIFFWGMVALARLVLSTWNLGTAVAVAGLAGFTPVVAHVHTHYWLDGPQVAFATVGAALFLFSLKRRSIPWTVAAGLMLGWACVTKMNAVLIVPAVLALGWSVTPEGSLRRIGVAATICSSVAGVVLAPWLWAQWRSFGEIAPNWAGKPTAELIEINPFVRFIATVRGPWSYLRLLPQAAATLVPALLAVPWMWREDRTRRVILVLCLWIAGVVLAHVGLGYIGYAKLLRYVILVTPAGILLFALAIEVAIRRIRTRGRRVWAAVFLLAATVAFVFELSVGVAYIRDYPDRALMLMYPDERRLRLMQ